MTHKQHFEAFKKEFDRCLSLLGVNGYLVDYFFEESLEDAVASVNTDTKNRRVFVSLAKDTISDHPIEHTRMLAAHEAVHVFLAPLVNLIPSKTYKVDLEEEACNCLAKLLRRTHRKNIN